MAANPRKSRPNKIDVALSDASPHNSKKAKRTERTPMNIGYARMYHGSDCRPGSAATRPEGGGVEKIFSEQSSSTAQRRGSPSASPSCARAMC